MPARPPRASKIPNSYGSSGCLDSKAVDSNRLSCCDAGMPTIAPSTKERIVLVAEALFAEHGLDGISLRQIGVAAGSGNNTAVQYHFGSKDLLIQAIFEYRLPGLHRRRDLIVAERQPADVRSWLECQIRPVLEQSELEQSHYLSFVAMLYQHGRQDVFERMPTPYLTSSQNLQRQLSDCLTSLPEPLRSYRLSQAMGLITHVGAGRERSRSRGETMLPYAVVVGDLLDAMIGFLEAPVSPSTRAAVASVPPVGALWPSFL